MLDLSLLVLGIVSNDTVRRVSAVSACLADGVDCQKV